MTEGPNWNLDENGETITVTFPTNPPVSMKLTAAAADHLIRGLGDLRAVMKPAIASDWALGQKVGAIPDPRWVTEPEVMMGNSLLHVRDPRFGWLHFLFPRAEARNLGQHLVQQADTPPPAPLSDKPN